MAFQSLSHIIYYLIFWIGDAKDWIWDLMFAKQMLKHWATAPPKSWGRSLSTTHKGYTGNHGICMDNITWGCGKEENFMSLSKNVS